MSLLKFPGFIDVHVHFRDPGATHKEDFTTGTKAALRGGFTFVLDMPNNPSASTVTIPRLEEKIALANQKALCDVGFHYGTDAKNLDTFQTVIQHPRVFGLKVYCEHTTGDLLVHSEQVLKQIFKAWQSEKPILVHGQGETLSVCLELAKKYDRRLHVCHVASIDDVEQVRKAKARNISVTAGATPHHLFLTEQDVARLGAFALVKPAIGRKDDQEALWNGLVDGTIDAVESDHAPHTRQEKENNTPPFGVPGLETTVGLLMKAVRDGKLVVEDVVRLLFEHPKHIFNIPDQPDTYIELDPDKPWFVGKEGYETKCGWSPFEGWELFGKIEKVVLRSKTLVEGGKVV